MDIPKDDSFMEIMALLRKRNQLCDEWMERITRDLKDGSITFEEYKDQARMIKEEMSKTGEAIKRQEEYLKNVKVIKKQHKKDL